MRAVLALLVALPLVAGCADERERARESYCEAVREHQRELTEITSGGGQTALLDALDIYRELRDEAPRDIADEWQQVVRSIEGLQTALDDAGVDPATYDPEKPPPGVTEQEQEEIAQAASEVASRETQQAFDGVHQQVRDVCHTQLTL